MGYFSPKTIKIGTMKNAKEKAEQLYGKFYFETADKKTAIKCALICVREIICANPNSNPLNNNKIWSTISYWMDVEKEINKL